LAAICLLAAANATDPAIAPVADDPVVVPASHSPRLRLLALAAATAFCVPFVTVFA
jgi:hypothetical protein